MNSFYIYFYMNFKIELLLKIQMLILNSNFLLLSNAASIRSDKSILFSRTAILIFIYCLISLIFTMNIKLLEKGISLLGGLISCRSHTQIFNSFLFILTASILVLTSFFPRKIMYIIKSKTYKFNVNNEEQININNEEKEQVLSSFSLPTPFENKKYINLNKQEKTFSMPFKNEEYINLNKQKRTFPISFSNEEEIDVNRRERKEVTSFSY